MKLRNIIYLVLFVCAGFVSTSHVLAETDITGSKDHALIPRIADSYILGYEYSEYGELQLALGPPVKERSSQGVFWKPSESKTVEGKLTRIMYIAPENKSTLEIIRNYEKALAKIGNYEELYSCNGKDCGKEYFFNDVIYPDERQLSGNNQALRHVWRGLFFYGDPRFIAAHVKSENSDLYISLLVARNLNKSGWAKKTGVYNKPVVLLEVIDIGAMDDSMVFVTADEMASEIGAKGHVTLYGIYFDFDSDTLKPESEETLKEIADLLDKDSSLKLHVVGHTDNQGSVEYNLGLSKRRAQSTVNALINRYGVTGNRLNSFGAGLYAPIASNDTEEGRAKNRRVELVKQ